jgi:hypothetical protein
MAAPAHCPRAAAAIELPRALRINAVSPRPGGRIGAGYGVIVPGHETVPAARVPRARVKSAEGALTGQVVRVL